MKKLTIALVLGTALLSCKKESKCYTCGIDSYDIRTGEYSATGRSEDFCGTDKELKSYVDQKLSQRVKLNCR